MQNIIYQAICLIFFSVIKIMCQHKYNFLSKIDLSYAQNNFYYIIINIKVRFFLVFYQYLKQ